MALASYPDDCMEPVDEVGERIEFSLLLLLLSISDRRSSSLRGNSMLVAAVSSSCICGGVRTLLE